MSTCEPHVREDMEFVRETLTIITNARPICCDDMFPDYHNKQELASAMNASLAKWNDTAFVANAMQAFSKGDVRLGMQLAREKVHHFLPSECNWGYLE